MARHTQERTAYSTCLRQYSWECLDRSSSIRRQGTQTVYVTSRIISCLCENSSEPRECIVHDGIGSRFEMLAVPGFDVKSAGLVAADNARSPHACLFQRNGEASPARETSTPGDGQNDGCLRDFVEGGRGDDQYWSSALLFMACRRIKRDEPDLSALHYRSSLPTGLASSQARSSSEGVSIWSHCAKSWSRV